MQAGLSKCIYYLGPLVRTCEKSVVLMDFSPGMVLLRGVQAVLAILSSRLCFSRVSSMFCPQHGFSVPRKESTHVVLHSDSSRLDTNDVDCDHETRLRDPQLAGT